MLKSLSVWNFALLAQVEVEFGSGLNILTGETGAGKSILIDALSAILGHRVSADSIRSGCDWLRVEAVFSLDDGQQELLPLLAEQEVECSDGELIIMRKVSSNGKSSILMNNSHVTLSFLRKIAPYLVDIHGQNENLALLREESQRQILEGGDPMLAFQIWRGGLGIWGGVAFGALGVYIAVKRAGVRLGPIADSLAPALLIAQAIGRWGNWFNQELFGAPTTLPWGLQIDAAHMPAGYPAGTLFHPTFLYECLWNLACAALIVWLDRRHRFAGGQVFGLYLMAYTAGRCWIEMLRIDDAHRVLGLRLNVWTSLLVFALGLLVFVVAGRLGRSTRVVAEDLEDPDAEKEDDASSVNDGGRSRCIHRGVWEEYCERSRCLQGWRHQVAVVLYLSGFCVPEVPQQVDSWE